LPSNSSNAKRQLNRLWGIFGININVNIDVSVNVGIND